ncbi:MAG TPA: KH domain-containing protein [Ignavibacteriaceae bacterium]
MKEFIEFIVKNIVDKPDNISVEENTPNDHTIEFKLKVDESDLGKVIGKQGKNVNAIRTLITAVGAKTHHRITLQLIE